MQNDVLKNEIAPWQEKGRWYHLTVKSSNSTWSIVKEKSDDFFSNSVISGNYVRVYDASLNSYKTCIVDVKYIMNTSVNAGQDVSTTGLGILYTPSIQEIYLFSPLKYTGELEIYIFIYG